VAAHLPIHAGMDRDHCPSGIVIADATDPDLPVIYVSPGFEQLTGYSADEVLGRNCRFLQGPETDPRAASVLTEALRAGREAHVTILNYRADGEPFWNELTIAPERDHHGGVVRYLGVQKDVTERLKADARIHTLAYYDSLTGLANRASLQAELRSAMHRASLGDQELALLYVDVDDFKRVNDRHGHQVGDQVLRGIADRLRAAVRPTDVLARQGGDEFLLLVPDVAEGASRVATDLAGRLLAALRTPVRIGDVEVQVRASVGVSTYPRDATTADELLRHADTAMYVAKGGGKDAYHLHRRRDGADGWGERAVDAFDPGAHVTELDVAIAHVRSLFQPIVQVDDGTVVAYEALARGPEGSALERPDRLFAAAQTAGRTVELDWACRASAVRAALDAGLGRQASLFLNCEPTAIDAPCPPEHADLWARAQRELDLVLEITERAVTDRPAELSKVIGDHRAAGHGIALDDLGADVRSLALLPFLEPDVMKLDLRLVQDRPSTDQAAIVSAVAAERERTGAAILAEGIETTAHLGVARSLGATLGQGWLWGRPAPLAELRRSAGIPRTPRRARQEGGTPFEVVAAERPIGEATKALLMPMSHHLEHRALRIGEGAVILSAFQSAERFTPATLRRYEILARSSSLVAAFGVGLGEEPVAGVRGAHLDPDDPLADEWSVVVLGPHFAGALVGRDLGDTGPDRERRFAFATVYDRTLVIAAARTLLARIAPRASVPA
jgi:diguanylate cyclase (GGDEF)-like protein/PAS domain S-box-containing protein